MGRLPNWNYKAPYYYMVTMKCLPGLPPLAILDGKAPHGVRAEYPLTARLQKVIFQFVERTPTVESVSPFVIMPDHLHLLIKIADIPERKSLADVVDLLRRLLRNAFQEEIGQKIPLFENEWHDLIVKKEKQLKNFRAYILANPRMALLRREHRDFFHCFRGVSHWRLGERRFDAVGTLG